MKIKDAIDFIEGLMNDAEKKSEKAFYKKFSDILKSLKNKDLDKEKIHAIENKLEELDLRFIKEKRVKYLKGKLREFTQFLGKEFSFIETGHYMSLGMVFGMMIGLALTGITGIDFGMGNQTTGGLIMGMIVGMVVGSVMDKNAEKDNRVLKTK